MNALCRRGFVRKAAAALPLLALLPTRAASAQGGGDRELLEQAVASELELVSAYGRAPGFDHAEAFRRHCQKHERGLAELLRNRGGRPPAPRATIGRPQGRAALLAAESEAVAGLHQAVGRLEDPDLLAVFASVMANHAQHQTVLRQELGQNPASLAFETGSVG